MLQKTVVFRIPILLTWKKLRKVLNQHLHVKTLKCLMQV